MKRTHVLEMDWEGDLEADALPEVRETMQAANMLRALANPHRLKILELLDHAPHNVMDLCDRLRLRQSLASQHLARLRVDGIVTAERKGHHVVYSIRDARARDILAVLKGVSPAHRPVKSSGRKARTNGAGLPGSRRIQP